VGDAQVIQYVETDFFAVYRWDLAGGGTANFVRKDAPYTLMSVLSGSGQLQINGQDYSLKKGQHLILPFQVKSWKISGQLEIIASEPGEKS
jgi:mannose-6-phosphate isomerase